MKIDFVPMPADMGIVDEPVQNVPHLVCEFEGGKDLVRNLFIMESERIFYVTVDGSYIWSLKASCYVDPQTNPTT